MSPIFAKVTGKLIMVLAVTLALIFGIVRCHDARASANETRVVEQRTGAVMCSAADATRAVSRIHGRDPA